MGGGDGCDRGREVVDRTRFEVMDCHLDGNIGFGDVERGSRRIVVVEIEWRRDFGIAARVELRLRALVGGGRFLLLKFRTFDGWSHDWRLDLRIEVCRCEVYSCK